MKKLRNVLFSLIIFSFVNSFLCSAVLNANFSVTPDINTLVKGEEFNVSLTVLPPNDINVSTFRLRVNFDNTKLKYTGLYSNYGSDDFKAYINEGNLTIIYLTSDYGVDLFANDLTSFLDLSFKVIDSADYGSTAISASLDGIGNYDVQEIFSNNIKSAEVNIVDKGAPNCNLKSIYAQGFNITPEFDPNITQYYTTVPSDTSSLDVEAVAEDPSASVNVSRKKLSAAGKTTDINITVTAADNKSKKIYRLTVLREDSSDVSSKNSKSSKDSSKSKNKSNSSSSKGSSGNSSKSGVSGNYAGNSAELLANNLNGLNVIKGNFNFILFFIVSSVCVGIAVFIIKKKSK